MNNYSNRDVFEQIACSFKMIKSLFMSKKIVYFSRSGNSKRIAEKISNRVTASEIVEITTTVSWRFFWGFLKAGYYTSADKDLDILLSAPISSTDEIILVAPVWAGKACQPARVFLKTYPNKTTVIFSSAGSKSNEISGIGTIVSSFDIIEKYKNEDEIIAQVVSS